MNFSQFMDEEKRKQIIESAKELFYTYGLKKTTMEDVAKKAGVGKGTLYLYFQNKEDIMKTIALESFSREIEKLKTELSVLKKAEERLRAFIRMKPLLIQRFVQENPHAADIIPYIDGGDIEKLGFIEEMKKYSSIFREILESGFRSREFRKVDPLELESFIQYISKAFTPENCYYDRVPLKAMIDRFTDILFCSLRK